MMRIVNNNDAPKESMEFSVCEASLIMMRPKEAIAQVQSEGDGFLMNKQMEPKIDNCPPHALLSVNPSYVVFFYEFQS